LLEETKIHSCLLPPNTKDRLQPLDVAVNKPAKEFYRQKFQEWYSLQVPQQIEELDGCVMALEPVKLGSTLNEGARGKMDRGNGRVHQQ